MRAVPYVCALCLFCGTLTAAAADTEAAEAAGEPAADASNPILDNPILEEADRDRAASGVSPARRIRRDQDAPRRPSANLELPAIDGSGNNAGTPDANAAHTPLRRFLPDDYADGADEMAGAQRASARLISNTVFAQSELNPNAGNFSDFLWQWGQFLDHDIDLTDGVNPPEEQPIPVPAGDPFFDPDNTGLVSISFNRSIYEHDAAGVRQQINEITGWIDASNVYGSSAERASALRRNDGSGKLLTSAGELLPFNENGLANAGGPADTLFLAGDVRANEQVGLAAMHTLFVREHNRLVDELQAANPDLSGEELYQRARRLVSAEMQQITYREFLPALLGPRALPRYRGYQADTDARIMNEFSGAAYRLGHSMLSPTLLRLDAQLQPAAEGPLPLRNAFFAPQELTANGIDSILRGLAMQVCQTIDAEVVDDVRNFLFGQPGAGGFDLVALNIQRGRDHGLPSYNEARSGFGLAPAASFADISSNPEVVAQLQAAYASVADVDLWVGGLAEDPHNNGQLGELFHTIVRQQFLVLRDGDRFWHRNTLNRADRNLIRGLTLGRIIKLNTDIGEELPDNVFRVGDSETPRRRG